MQAYKRRDMANYPGLNKFNLNHLATYIYLHATLAGCSGGDSKVGTAPAADTTAPQVLITTPTNSAICVALNSKISATFSEVINPATLSFSTFIVNGVNGQVKVSDDKRSASFTPVSALKPKTRYTVTLTGGVRDTAGNAMYRNFSWAFTTCAAATVRSRVRPLAGPVGQQAGTSTIIFSFNEPLNCTTVSTDSYHVLKTGAPVLCYTECSGGAVRFRPRYGYTAVQPGLTPAITYLPDYPISAYSWPFGTAGIDSAEAISLDAAGNVYAAGYTGLKFYTGDGLAGQASVGSADLFITRYNASGSKQWTHQLGTAGDLSAHAISSDAAGNVYVAGSTGGALDGQVSAGGYDLFIAKYDTNGVKQWTRQLGTAAYDTALAITSDTTGNVYAAGRTGGALDGQASAGDADFFIIKYDASGVKQWVRQLGTAGSDIAYAITTDAAGNVYAAGYTSGALDGQISAGGADFFIIKYDASGVKQWTRQLGTAAYDTAHAISSDAAGNVYAAGYTGGALDGQISAGGADLFIVKYDASGKKQWARQLGTAGYDTAQAISSDAAGNVYATGYTSGALEGQTNAADSDLFIVKYQSDGRKR
jgi:hypothetical protein